MENLKYINNTFEMDLVKDGYKVHPDNLKNAIRMFQKRVYDNYGTKYYINCYHYNHNLINYMAENKDEYSFDVQYTIDENYKDQTVDISFNGKFIPDSYGGYLTPLWEVEQFFENMFIHLNADYKEK